MFMGSINYLLISKGFGTLNMIVFTFLNLGLAFFYVNYNKRLKGINVLFWIVTIYFLSLLVLGISPDQAIVEQSRNYISVYYLYFVTLYYVEKLKFNKNINLLPALFVMIICIWAYGRSSVFVGIVLFAGILFLQVKVSVKRFAFYSIVITLIILVLLTIGVFEQVYDYAFQRFQERSIEGDPRFIIINNYFNNLQAKNLFFGFDVNNSEYLFLEWGQPHNSFLRLHHRFGIWGFLKIAIVLLLLIRSFFVNKYIFLFLFLLLFRSFFDIAIFAPNEHDFIVYIVMYFALGKFGIDRKFAFK